MRSAPLPNQTLTVNAVSAYVGVVKGFTADTITINLAISIPDHPEGPHFPPNAASVVRNVTVLNRVGNSAPFPIGENQTVTMPANGQLFLGINDDFVGDNQGGYRVNVQRTNSRR